MSVKKISQLNPLTSNEVTSSIDLLAIVDTTNTETKKITVDNLLSGGNYSVSGSFSGSFQGDGSGITGVTGEWDGSHVGNASITGSLTVTTNISASDKVFGDRIIVGTYVQTPSLESPTTVITVNDNINVNGHITASGDISSSADVYGVTGSFLHLLGDGSQLTGVESEWDGTLNGNGEITGSLIVTGDITGSNISASNTVYGITGSFSHLLGSSPLTVESDNFNIDSSGNITSSANISASGDLYSNYLTTTRDITVGRDATFSRNVTKVGGNGSIQYKGNSITYIQTNDNTPTLLASIPITSNKITTINAHIQCQINSNNNLGGYWNIVGTFGNDGGSGPVLIGTPTSLVSHEYNALLDVTMTAGGTNVEITVTGRPSTATIWTGVFDQIQLVANNI